MSPCWRAASIVTRPEDRRPIAQRGAPWARAVAQALVKAGITPNAISLAGLAFACLAGACFAASGLVTESVLRGALLIGAALGCQLRLLCNMLDGMVADLGGKTTRDGAIWNEIPDRLADIAVLIGAGYGAAFFGAADPALGWATALAAVMTAYVREAVRGAGAPMDFAGPLAKPRRMFVMTLAALISALAAFVHQQWDQGVAAVIIGRVIAFALWIVVIGASLTALNRLLRALRALR